MVRNELENSSWHRPSGRCSRAENSGRTPGGSPVPQKILKLNAGPTGNTTSRVRAKPDYTFPKNSPVTLPSSLVGFEVISLVRDRFRRRNFIDPQFPNLDGLKRRRRLK